MRMKLTASETSLNDADYENGTDDYCLPIEEYLDRNFGNGTWVLDPYNDKFVVWDTSHQGPEKSYIVIDRDYRRFTATVPATCVN